jgi:hypothetical protein
MPQRHSWQLTLFQQCQDSMEALPNGVDCFDNMYEPSTACVASISQHTIYFPSLVVWQLQSHLDVRGNSPLCSLEH